MNYRRFTATSAMAVALFLLFLSESARASLPLTETIYCIPENQIELYLQEQAVQVEKYYRRDRIGVGLGVLHSFSIWFEFNYLTQGLVPTGKSEIGDLFIKGKIYIGDYFDGLFHASFLLRFRIPTGKNAYATADWRNLSLGKNELTLGPVFRMDFLAPVYLHFNLLYTFREGLNEDFYGGFYFNIFKGDTWSKLFGLNPWSDGTFLNRNRLNNDYISLSLAANTDVIYPVIPFLECYASFRVSRSAGEELDSIPIEALGINPVLLLSAGVRYFFSDDVYLGAYAIVNPLWQKNYIKMIYGIDLSLQF